MSITSAAIKVLFKTYFDDSSFNFSNEQLNSIFAKASMVYWDKLIRNYGQDTENLQDLSTITKAYSFTPSASTFATSEFTTFYALGTLKPTYTGVTSLFPAKPYNPENSFSPYSAGTTKYPKYEFLLNEIKIYPTANVPTNIAGTYFITPPVIDFTSGSSIGLSEKNWQGIIQLALVQVGISQREFDYGATISQENNAENS